MQQRNVATLKTILEQVIKQQQSRSTLKMRGWECDSEAWADSWRDALKPQQKPVELDEKVNADMMLMLYKHMAPPGFDGSCQH